MSRRVVHNDVRHDLPAANRCASGVDSIPFRVAWANSFARVRCNNGAGSIPFWVAWVPARRDLPVPDDAKGKLVLAHATRKFPRPHSGGTRRLAIDV